MYGTLLMTAIFTYSSFAWAIFKFFERETPNELPPRMRLLGATGLVGTIVQLIGIALAADRSESTSVFALALYSTALFLFWWAIGSTRREKMDIAFTTRRSVQLNMHGPYAWVRHPFYSAYIVAWIAGAIAGATWWTWLPLIVMFPQYFRAIRHEESQFLDGPLAIEYATYVRRTGMLIPNGWKIARDRCGLLTTRCRRTVNDGSPVQNIADSLTHQANLSEVRNDHDH